jgi:hypothetical protein
MASDTRIWLGTDPLPYSAPKRLADLVCNDYPDGWSLAGLDTHHHSGDIRT